MTLDGYTCGQRRFWSDTDYIGTCKENKSFTIVTSGTLQSIGTNYFMHILTHRCIEISYHQYLSVACTQDADEALMEPLFHFSAVLVGQGIHYYNHHRVKLCQNSAVRILADMLWRCAMLLVAVVTVLVLLPPHLGYPDFQRRAWRILPSSSRIISPHH